MDHAAATTNDCRLSCGMVRRAEGWLGQQRPSVREHTCHRVDRSDLQGSGPIKAWQHSRNSLGQHRFARARWPKQAEMMPAGSAYLGGAARCGLTQHISQIQAAASRRPSEQPGAALLRATLSDLNRICLFCHGFTAKPAEEAAEGFGAQHPESRYQRRLGGIGVWHSHPAESAGRRGGHSRQHSPNRANLAVKSKFTKKRHTFEGSSRDSVRCAQDRDGYAEIKSAAPLGQAGR